MALKVQVWNILVSRYRWRHGDVVSYKAFTQLQAYYLVKHIVKDRKTFDMVFKMMLQHEEIVRKSGTAYFTIKL